eukprot:364943-Chlamydomonas_euryale.AAC.11
MAPYDKKCTVTGTQIGVILDRQADLHLYHLRWLLPRRPIYLALMYALHSTAASAPIKPHECCRCSLIHGRSQLAALYAGTRTIRRFLDGSSLRGTVVDWFSADTVQSAPWPIPPHLVFQALPHVFLPPTRRGTCCRPPRAS